MRAVIMAALGTLVGGCAATPVGSDIHLCPSGVEVYDHGGYQHVGEVLHHPVVNLIFWGKWDKVVEQQYLSALQSMSAYMGGRLSEYGVSGFTVGYVNTWDQVVDPISALPAAFPGVDTVNVLMYPKGYLSASMLDCGCDAHHMWDDRIGAYVEVSYQDNFQFGTVVISHELWEAFTNPRGHTYYNSGNNQGDGKEIADLCDNLPRLVLPDGTHIEGAWSQQACKCQ